MKTVSRFPLLKTGFSDVVQNDETIDNTLIFTTGKVIDYILSSLHDIIVFLCNILEKAENEVLFVMSYWEGASLSAAMINRSIKKILAEKTSVKIRIIVDNGTWKNLFSPTREILPHKIKSNLGLKVDTSKHDLRAKSVHFPLFGTMHAKFLLVDRRVVVICSNNIQDRPNSELAISMEGNVCSGFLDIFRKLWKEEISSNYMGPKLLVNNSSWNDEVIIANRKMYGGICRDVVSTQNCAWWLLMSIAHKEIIISTPTFNAFHAITCVLRACIRGVNVTLILTKNFNDKKEALPFQGGTNLYVVKHMYRKLQRNGKGHEKNLVIRWHVGKYERQPRIGAHSHVKFMTIDGEIIMFGNGNMDTQSWYHSMETNVIVEESELVKQLNEKTIKNSSLFTLS